MALALENEICPGRHIDEAHLKKMTLKQKLKHVNTYLEQLVPIFVIAYVDDFENFVEMVSTDYHGIQSAIPNLFESFRNKELVREGIISLVADIDTADEPSLYFIVSMLQVLSSSDANKVNIVKSGTVQRILARLTPSKPPLTAVIPSLSLFEELFQHRPSLQEIFFQASMNEIEKGALLAATTVGASLEFAARKRNPTGIQNLVNNLVSLSKIDLIRNDDALVGKLAKILAGAYKEEGIQQYVERSGGHELVVKAAMKQIVVLHNEIAENDVRFDYDGLLYDSPLCRVFRGTYDKQRVAIKVFSVDSLGFDVQNFNKEIALMSIVRGENVVKCYGVKTKGDTPFVVMEYFSNGSLNDFITLNPYEIPLRTKVYLMLGAANGIRFLHEKSIIHRDIKTQNFMVGEEFLKCKVIDFGVSRVDALVNAKKTVVGTPVFMAPEVMHEQQYTYTADTYSFGLVMWEMMTKNTPYFDVNPLRVAEHIMSHRPAIPADCDPLLARLMKACWAAEPSHRPLFTQIIDTLSQFTFPLNVKTHRSFVPKADADVVDFARLYLVLEPATYARVFTSLDVHDRAAVRETCKYWKTVVDENKQENGN